jgi:MEMO1 family protein
MSSIDKKLQNREPAVAGQFYPATGSALKADLEQLFSEVKSDKALTSEHIDRDKVLAVISPHAGYVFSGRMAATSFSQIDPDKQYNTIFVIGSSHRIAFNGASVYNKGNYITPLGEVKVDRSIANLLINEYEFFTFRPDAHVGEHSLEVQLPFLQYHLKKDFKIVPIIMGTQNAGTCKKIAKALKPYFNEENLFVISTDFSHYPKYDDAIKVDKQTADAIMTNNPAKFINTLDRNRDMNIPNLLTSICGWTSALTLLYITQDMPDIRYIHEAYQNSGDAKTYGDKSRVVGYQSIVVVKGPPEEKKRGFGLSRQDKKDLIHIARSTVETYAKKHKRPGIDTSNFSPSLLTPAGAFVTLRKKGKLRGCIGSFNPDIPLYRVVQEMAVSAASKDYRFSPVTPDELADIDIEISVLTPLKKINSIDEIKLGKDGIYIKKGSHSGTFLPQVATETGWKLEEFLGHCARDKAGIGWDGWTDAEIYTYEALIFSEKEK